MAYEIRNNSGSAFKNRSPRGDKPANLTGSGMVDNKEYWINVWIKQDKNGNDWFSFSFKEKQPRPPQHDGAGTVPELDDTMPF
jgi:hypothetical protein